MEGEGPGFAFIYSTVTTNKFSLFIKACRTSLFWLILGKHEKLTSNAKERNNRERKENKRYNVHKQRFHRILHQRKSTISLLLVAKDRNNDS